MTNIDFIQPNILFTNLHSLSIASNLISDINNIRYLKETLIILNIGNNKSLNNITDIKHLTKLKSLCISDLELNNKKETIDILKSLKELETIVIQGTLGIIVGEKLEKELTNIKIILK